MLFGGGLKATDEDSEDTLFMRTQIYHVFFKEGGVPDKPLRRARLEAACFHLKQRLSLCWDDKFLLSSQRPFPSGCLWVYMNFSNSLGSDRGASPSCRLLTHLPSVFFPPQDHCLQRRWQNKGSDRQKSAVAMHPLSQPPSPYPYLVCSVTHIRHLCTNIHLQICGAREHFDVKLHTHARLPTSVPCSAAEQTSLLKKDVPLL